MLQPVLGPQGATVFIYLQEKYLLGTFMSEFYYYKGLNKVKVVTESDGYWIVEALEDFEDCSESESIMVKRGERRIVPSDTLFKQKRMIPMVKEHEYELNMEKKLKRMIAESDETAKK
jgi:hypothetical protein